MTPGTSGFTPQGAQGCQIDRSTANELETLNINGQTLTDVAITRAREFIGVKVNAALCPNGVCWVYTPLLLFMADPTRSPDTSAAEWIIYSNLYRDKIDPYDGAGDQYYTEANWLKDWGTAHVLNSGDESLEVYLNQGDWNVADDTSTAFEAVHALESLGVLDVAAGSGADTCGTLI